MKRANAATCAMALMAAFACAFAGPAASAAPSKGAAAPVYNLSELPEYEPSRIEETDHCHGDKCNGEWGTIRVQTNTNMMEMVQNWQIAFSKIHPNVNFDNLFRPSGIGGLVSRIYDIGILGHAAWRSDYVAFRNVYGHNPIAIQLTGGYDEGIQSAPVFVVHKDNPLRGLTVDQVDGIFGAQRTGGWTDEFEWTTAPARSAASNIRTWGQLGLKGEWADKPIKIYGFDSTLSGWSHLIQQVAFKGGDKWNPAIVEKVRGGQRDPADAEIARAVASDKYSIGFNLTKVVKKWPGLRTVPIAAGPGQPYVAATAESVFNRTYPFTNNVYIYIDKPEGQSIPPRVKEFLTFALSRQGQQILIEYGRLTPLNAEASRREIAKLQ